MAHRARQDYPTPSPSPSPPPTVKQEELPLSNSISSPHLESTGTLALTLPEPRTQAQLNKEDRRLPCEQCRKVRRACRWVKVESLERSSCERCMKTGKQCSGPTRRSQSNLEIVQPLRQLQTRNRAIVSIGPSSPESRWSTKHMSYSLTYHLVETGLESLNGNWAYIGFDYASFLSRFRTSQGRLEEPDSIDELFALAQMFAGSRCTSHTAFVRADSATISLDQIDMEETSPETLIAIGLARREPILSVTRRVIARAESMRLSPACPERAAEQMSVWLCTVKFMLDLEETTVDRLRLIRAIVQRGLDYIADRGGLDQVQVDGAFLEPLKEIMLDEIRFSLLLGSLPNTSLQTCKALVYDLSPPCLPTIPTIPSDISFIFSAPPEPAHVREVAIAFQNDLRVLTPRIFQHLEYTLAYTPRRKMLQAVTYCLKRLSELATVLQSLFDRILFDARYHPKDPRPRPNNCLLIIISLEYDALFTLKSCHVTIEQMKAVSEKALQESEKQWSEALSHLSERLDMFASLVDSRIDSFVAASDFVERLRLCPGYIFTSWARLNPVKREK